MSKMSVLESPKQTQNYILILFVKMWVKLNKLSMEPILQYILPKNTRQAHTHTHTYTHTNIQHSCPVYSHTHVTKYLQVWALEQRAVKTCPFREHTHTHSQSHSQTFSILILSTNWVIYKHKQHIHLSHPATHFSFNISLTCSNCPQAYFSPFCLSWASPLPNPSTDLGQAAHLVL